VYTGSQDWKEKQQKITMYKVCCCWSFLFVCFCSAGYWTQDLADVSQVLYHWATFPAHRKCKGKEPKEVIGFSIKIINVFQCCYILGEKIEENWELFGQKRIVVKNTAMKIKSQCAEKENNRQLKSVFYSSCLKNHLPDFIQNKRGNSEKEIKLSQQNFHFI
jgi:hypothetical protein